MIEKRTASNQTFPTEAHHSRPSQPALPLRQTRTFLTQLRREAQALKEQPVRPRALSVPVQSADALQPALQLKNLPYFVRRTPSNQLPVYLITKAGGTKQQTKIQKTEGDVDALRNDLARSLGVESSKDVTINRLNGHIIVKVCVSRSGRDRLSGEPISVLSQDKINAMLMVYVQGWRKPEIIAFLTERNF